MYKLSALLGRPFPSDGYRWVSGTWRPSPLYLERLNHLILLKALDGWTVEDMESIDWETYGAESRSPLPGHGGDLSKKELQYRPAVDS